MVFLTAESELRQFELQSVERAYRHLAERNITAVMEEIYQNFRKELDLRSPQQFTNLIDLIASDNAKEAA